MNRGKKSIAKQIQQDGAARGCGGRARESDYSYREASQDFDEELVLLDEGGGD